MKRERSHHFVFSLLKHLSSALYPPRCPICEKIPPKGFFICSSCYASISFVQQPFCYSCGKPLETKEQELCFDCCRTPKSFTRGFSLAVYNEITKPSLSAIKYKNRRQHLNFYIQETITVYGPLFHSLHLDAVLSIPIHPKRMKKRGFNQASLFASAMGKHLNVPFYDSVIIRTINTLPQKALSPEKRLENLQRAFSLHPELKDSFLPFQRVLLIDDIYTTGATMEAVTRLLKQAGVSEVYIFSICIGKGC
ncbi:MAG: ComF family protein [Lachnospiraceae bacterium]|nr:ComF family protein [Lachnospiraceae bacterium]